MRKLRAMASDDAELVKAATSLVEALRALERATSEVESAPLGSRGDLEKAAKKLEALAGADERLNAHVQRLAAAVQAARARRQEQSARLSGAALRLQERTEAWRVLMERFAGIASEAGALNAATRDAPDFASHLVERVDALVQEAAALGEEAQAGHFEDVAQLARTVRGQLLEVRGSLASAEQHPPGS